MVMEAATLAGWRQRLHGPRICPGMQSLQVLAPACELLAATAR